MLRHTCNYQIKLIGKGNFMTLKALLKNTLHWTRGLSLGSTVGFQRVGESTARPELSTDLKGVWGLYPHCSRSAPWFQAAQNAPITSQNSLVFLLESHYIGLFRSWWFSTPFWAQNTCSWFSFFVLLLKLTHSNSFTLTCGEGVLYLYCLTHFNKEFKELHLLTCGIQSGLFEIAVP